MSEVMICRGSSGAGDEKKKVFKREIIENNIAWTVPDIVNNEVYVRLFGAGYDGSSMESSGGLIHTGGGSGWMNNSIIKLQKGGLVYITVANNSNETTSFGSFLIANSGSYKEGGSSGGGYLMGYPRAYQFGGGGGENSSGGVWGGGGGGYAQGGNGGKYGGGGGGGYGNLGFGGTYGGNGGDRTVQAENGTNTIGWTNIDKDITTGEYITGPGLAGSWTSIRPSGGGGFGGCGGTSILNWSGAGGGGYGGNGGSTNHPAMKGGGGGGYGKGADSISNFTGGGGYFTPATGNNGAGWGIYGYGGLGNTNSVENLIKDQSDCIPHNAGPGVCVIEYYVWEDSKSK